MSKQSQIAALLMAAALVLAAAGCSSAPSSSSVPDEPSSSSVPESSSSQAPVREYFKGVTAGNEYFSEFWGLKFTPPHEGIMLATPEQMSELLGYGGEAMGTDPELVEQIQQQLDAYELVAVDMETGATLVVTSAELPMSGISAETYTKSALESVKGAGSNVTIALDNDGTPFKETLAGKEFACVSYTVEGENVPANHQTQRIFIDGKHALIVTSTYPPAIEASKAMQETLLASLTAIVDPA